ncbi:hypothetical protein HG15A2_23430 [Adhaeretor mobilis]|uniref:Uncharacterized protein n=2 Tax=Adhaeretor mobilis TaxID=1930276 RepID=A0A517MVZ3_9BACT|nr:hypothetical protein HG15A2_23430 [Adhaeretor mobilis]
MAMTLVKSGSALKPSDFYDRDEDVVVTATLEGVSQQALQVLSESHREKIATVVYDERVTLVRRYPSGGGKSVLRCYKKTARDERFSEAGIADAIQGTGAALRHSFESKYPELIGEVGEGKLTQKRCKEVVAEYIGALGESDLILVEASLPTGIEQSITDLLPEVVFIPAVKDVRDELKTTESASFGKIISILMSMIQESDGFQAIEESFAKLNNMINRQEGDSGTSTDNRLDEVKSMESIVGQYVGEQFRDVTVSIEIPPPSVRDVFRNARIILDDGVPGDVDTKGDGIKRAVTFALLRTFVDLSKQQKEQEADGDKTSSTHGHFLFLFEEPELYLHPNAQRILFDALTQISSGHQVCVCTHSPYFFSPDDAGTFLRIRKSTREVVEGKAPITEVLPIQLCEKLSVKDLYQLLCYENNSAAFFCDRVVLVEGDCDIIYLQHAAKALDPSWDFQRRNVSLVQVRGKGNFARFREFFELCGVEVRIVADLDAIADQFSKLQASPAAVEQHSALLQAVDQLRGHQEIDLTKDQKKEIVRSYTFQEKYGQLRQAVQAIHECQRVELEDLPSVDAIFGREVDYARRNMLAEATQVEEQKLALLSTLLAERIYVLSRGAVEEYYPASAAGKDKPSKAIHACKLAADRDTALGCSDPMKDGDNGERTELELIFSGIFDDLVTLQESSEDSYPTAVEAL